MEKQTENKAVDTEQLSKKDLQAWIKQINKANFHPYDLGQDFKTLAAEVIELRQNIQQTNASYLSAETCLTIEKKKNEKLSSENKVLREALKPLMEYFLLKDRNAGNDMRRREILENQPELTLYLNKAKAALNNTSKQ